jgi:hypothetical protein
MIDSVPRTSHAEPMPRCEGYYTLENRRCPNEGANEMKAVDGDRYGLCEYHADAVWTTTVARWHGGTELRASAPVELQAAVRVPAFVW